jgi:hypothetical protein
LLEEPDSLTTADREEGAGRAYVMAPEPSIRPAIPAAADCEFDGKNRSCF